MIKAVLEFDGQFRFLSNFFLCSFVWENITWPHSEAAYQAAKCADRSKWLEFAHLSPGQSKRKGKKVILRDDWDDVRIELMAEIIFAKFDQNPHLKQLLLATGDAILIEGNSWDDKFWGVSPVGSGNGLNHLGRLLMQLRTLFKIQLECEGQATAAELLDIQTMREEFLSNNSAGNGLVSF